MSSGELSFEFPPFVRVTWTIPDFFQLDDFYRTEPLSFLRSPDFTLADCCHYMRLWKDSSDVLIRLIKLNLNSLDTERAVSYEVQLKSTGEEIRIRRSPFHSKHFYVYQSDREHCRDVCVPGGTLIVLCSMRPRLGSAVQNLPLLYHPPRRMTGNLTSESFPCLYVKWRIPEFFQRTRRCDLVSPEFPFSDRRYHLRLFLHQFDVKICLVNLTDSVPGRYVWYEVGLKSTTGEEIKIISSGTSTKRRFSIDRCDLDAIHHVHFSDGHLTVFCCMRSREPSSARSPRSGGAKISNEDDKEALTDISKLSLDFRHLLQKMPDSDAYLVVSGKEFRAHQNILRTRSTVFDAMFSHEMAERKSGHVVIDDLEPDSFGDFLEYLYTGTVREGLSDNNTFGLYKAADKYDVPTLKVKCLAHMRRSLSVDSFCDILVVALLHSEQELLSEAVLFFKENMARIIVTAKWKQFVTDNYTSANEFYIHSFIHSFIHAPRSKRHNFSKRSHARSVFL